MNSPLTIPTRVSKALWDEHIIFGKKLFAEVADLGITSLLTLVTAGRSLSEEDRILFERIAACVCIADPHIWPLKITRVASSHGRFVPGLVAGLLLFESERVGPLTTRTAAEWLTRISEKLGAESSDVSIDRVVDEVLRDMRVVAGFGVPFRDEDERLTALERYVHASAAGTRRFYRLFAGAVRWMKRERGIAPNVSALAASLLLDMGFRSADAAPIMLLFCHLAQIPNALEGAAEPASILRELPRESISYEGHAPRELPITVRSTRR